MNIFGVFKAFSILVIGLEKTVHGMVGMKAFTLPIANHEINIDGLKEVKQFKGVCRRRTVCLYSFANVHLNVISVYVWGRTPHVTAI